MFELVVLINGRFGEDFKKDAYLNNKQFNSNCLYSTKILYDEV